MKITIWYWIYEESERLDRFKAAYLAAGKAGDEALTADQWRKKYKCWLNARQSKLNLKEQCK